MIPRETVDLILDTARIEDVIGDFVALKRRGADFVACCPFHNEKTPSFHVSPSKGIYKCFGCGKAGSAVGFLMEHENMEYAEALRYIAAKYHIEVQEEDASPEEIIQRQRSESLYLVSEFAARFFAGAMNTPEGRSRGYAYCRSRGIEDATMERFGLGWAPMSRTALVDAATAAGHKVEYLIDAGLAVRYDDGKVADKFHERVMFPIHSVSGRVIAFSGRTLRTDDNVAKYMNSPETEIYKKSRILFGIYLAKSEINRQDNCYLVEGNVDVVSLHQLGITNVVAPCGTALTQEQVRLIKKFTSNVTVMFDGDKAGIKAAVKSIGMILEEDMNVKVVLFPDGDDPDSFSRKHTLGEVRSFLEGARQDFIEFKSDLLADDAKNDPLKRATLINDISDTIALIPDAVKRSVYAETVAQRFNIESAIIFNRIASQRKLMIEQRNQEVERARRRVEAGLDPVPEWEAPSSAAPMEREPEDMALSRLEENKTVARVERDLLYFLLTHGCDTLEFPSDSEYAPAPGEEAYTVADFIISSVEDGDGGDAFLNHAYQRTFSAYVSLYDEGQGQEAILRAMLNSADRETAFVTAQLSMEKYQLTMKDLARSMTSTSSWLVTFVPKAVLLYNEKKLEVKIQLLRDSLPSAGEEEAVGILSRMTALQKLQRQLKVKTGRDKDKNNI